MLGLAIYNGVILPLHFPQVGAWTCVLASVCWQVC